MFICPGCKARFRVTKAPRSGKIKCPKCGLISQLRRPVPPSHAAVQAPGAVPAAAPPAEPPPPELSANTTVAGHKILEYVGGSQVTACYRASQTSMGRTVLFKVLRPAYVGDAKAKGRFFAGARAAARLNHPNLLSVFDMGEEGEVCFYTTEFVDGGNLLEFLSREERTTSDVRLAIATQVANALAYAQSSGVEQVWLGPEDVLLTDKGDVRVGHVGTGQPQSDGRVRPTLRALAELLYLTATGTALPAGPVGEATPLSMPTARDALGSKLNALVGKLVKEGQEAYSSVSVFAAELQKLSESEQRRGTVHAASAPGGVVPLRLGRAQRRELPVKAILAVTVVAAGLGAIVLFFVLNSLRAEKRAKEAETLWRQAKLEAADSRTLPQALLTLQKLARGYLDTEYGRQAHQTAIWDIKRAMVRHEYSQARQRFKDKPEELEPALAGIKAAREKLEQMLPADRELIAEYEKRWTKTIEKSYFNVANRDWNETVAPKVRDFRKRMQYEKAVEAARAAASKWPHSKDVTNAASGAVLAANREAETTFNSILAKVEGFVKEGRKDKAEEQLGKVIRNFGEKEFKEYVDRARAKLREIRQ